MHVRPAASMFLPMVLAAVTLIPPANAQTSGSALINEALDKPVDLDLNTTLPQALKTISDKTGVPIRAAASVFDMLPWGDQTKLTAKVNNQTLRSALSAICAQSGLRYFVGDDAVELRPMPALDRLARRVTRDELESINILGPQKFAENKEAMSVDQLATSIDNGLKAINSQYVIDNRVGDDIGKQPVKLPRDAGYVDALEEMNRQTRATWYPVGKSIAVVPKEELVNTLLSRPISMRYNGVDVSQVLAELSRRSGVDFTIEPGAVQRIPPESRVIRLTLENASAKQALESVSGFTGLGYLQNENGVYIWNPAAAPVARRPDRVVAIIRLENGTELMLPENEVPGDVKQYLQSRKEAAIKTLREQMKKEGFKPSTQPTD